MADLVKELFSASEAGDAGKVKQLLGQGVDPNSRHPENNRTALFPAAMYDHRPVVKLLLKAGVDPNIREIDDGCDFRGETAMFIAGKSGNDVVMNNILNSGRVDISITNSDGSTVADVTPSLSLKRKMILEHGLQKRRKCERESESDDSWVWHHCLWMTTFEGESLLEPTTKRVRRSELVIDAIDLSDKSLPRLIETCAQSGFICEQVDKSYYDRLFIGTRLTSPRISELLMAMRSKPSSLNTAAIWADVNELFGEDEIEEARKVYGQLIGELFPMSLKAVCRLVVLHQLPTGFEQRKAAIDSLKPLLTDSLCKYLMFEH